MAKNKFLISGILLIIIASFAFLAGRTVKKEEPVLQKNGFEMSVKSISQTDNFYNVQVEYPQFNNTGEEFNKKISSSIEGELADFKKNSKDNWDARQATASGTSEASANPASPFDFIADWDPIQLNDKYISFAMNVYYFSGGAHGITEVDTFNYDISKNKEITIMDFLNSSQPALEKLASLAALGVEAQIQGNGVAIDDNLKQMIEQGTRPVPENYAYFNFDYNSLTIRFQQYQVAPGYLGPITVVLYKSDLEKDSITSSYFNK